MTTTTAAAAALVGPGVDRVDGRLKVAGAARYPSDFSLPDMAHAALVRAARDKRVRLNIPPIAHMRAPALAEGNFALESLLDELSYELGMDPIELRLRNYAEVHPQTGLPWSSKALRECYE